MTETTVQADRLSDREHFEAVVRRYQGPLLRYARCSLGTDDAQDVVQVLFEDGDFPQTGLAEKLDKPSRVVIDIK